MMNDHAFRQQLDALWDAGLDPIDDPTVQAWLDAHPEHLEDFAAERADLLTLGRDAGQAVDHTHVPEALPEVLRAQGSVGRRVLQGAGVVAVAAAAALLVLWAPPTSKASGNHESDRSAQVSSVGTAREVGRVLSTTVSARRERTSSRVFVDITAVQEFDAPDLQVRISRRVHRPRRFLREDHPR